MTPEERARQYGQVQQGLLPGELGLVWDELEAGRAKAASRSSAATWPPTASCTPPR